MEAEFRALNAAFVDVTLRRWEAWIAHRTRMERTELEPAERDQAEERAAADERRYEAERTAHRARAAELGATLPLDQVVQTYGLDGFEASILELALAPYLDVSFRTLLARYNNNVLFDFVDVDVALSLLVPQREARLMARACFAGEARLMAHRLLTLAVPREAKGQGLLARELRPPERLADYVLGRESLDPTLRPHARLLRPKVDLDQVVVPGGTVEALRGLVFAMRFESAPRGVGSAPPFLVGRGLAVEVSGPPGTGKTLLAHALAGELGRPLLEVNCQSLSAATDARELIDALFSEARVQGAVLLLDRCEPLLAKNSQRTPALLASLDAFGGLVVLTNTAPDELDGSVERHVAWKVELELPDVDERLRIWELCRPTGVSMADDVDIVDLAARFEVTGGQVARAWEVAERWAHARAAGGVAEPLVTQADIQQAAQAQIRANMSDYAVRSKVGLTLDDLVLPDKEKVLITEVLEACTNRVFVMSKWGFGKRLVTGRGICVLFKGEPGTGKTLCAEILASELGIKLYQISIPKIVSKYIGETEKNIAKIFHSARANHSMLLFDEADSLFTKRVSVENAIDRFSNMETNLLLQEIERFEGICILTTNLDKNIDDAFARRIQFKIEFPFPESDFRTAIWRKLIPKECPVDEGIDFERLGTCFELSGGHIKNAVLRAAYRAAARQRSIEWADFEFAAEQECKNAGKLFRTSAMALEQEW
ncbi:MAG: ATP-binding protein [Deltaproteobacteria bacterium]|nr:ATP-binding protein [Deltaproteobacteria bacterium]MCB9785404.1 ATP-binding protein [Deltaproteobacteria bacterium]